MFGSKKKSQSFTKWSGGLGIAIIQKKSIIAYTLVGVVR